MNQRMNLHLINLKRENKLKKEKIKNKKSNRKLVIVNFIVILMKMMIVEKVKMISSQ